MNKRNQKVELKEKPIFVWSPVYGVITDNGNYLFFRRATSSKNIFWYSNRKVRKQKDGTFYMPPKFHKMMAWLYVPSEDKFFKLEKPVWGDAKAYPIKLKFINEETIGQAIHELHKEMARRPKRRRM